MNPTASRQLPKSVNAQGQVAGNYMGFDGIGRGFIYSGGSYTTIDPAGNLQVNEIAINDAGEVAGGYVKDLGNGDGTGQRLGFLYDNGSYTILDVPGSTSTDAVAINAAGEVIGFYTDADFNQHGFIYSNGNYTTLDVPGSTLTQPESINTQGQTFGYFYDGGGEHGFVYSNGSFTILDAPGGSFTSADWINDAGEVVGSYYDDAGQHSFTWINGNYTIVDAVGSSETVLLSVNGTGEGAGYAEVGPHVHGITLTPAYIVTTDTGGATLGLGNVVTIKVHVSEPVVVTGTPGLQLNNNEVAAYTGGSGTALLSFSYTVQNGDSIADLQVTGANFTGRHHQGRRRQRLCRPGPGRSQAAGQKSRRMSRRHRLRCWILRQHPYGSPRHRCHRRGGWLVLRFRSDAAWLSLQQRQLRHARSRRQHVDDCDLGQLPGPGRGRLR